MKSELVSQRTCIVCGKTFEITAQFRDHLREIFGAKMKLPTRCYSCRALRKSGAGNKVGHERLKGA